MRSAIFTLVGAILVSTAALLYGMVFLDGAMQEPAFFLVIGSTVLGGFLGLLIAALTRPSRTRPAQLILLGAVGGLLAGLAYGVVALEEACEPGGIDPGPCGWLFLGRLFQYPWMPIALWAVLGGVVGTFLGWTAARLPRGRMPKPAASV
jgi:RsiW-degrading membrane proteinase PrsW (M82 family)